MAGMHDIFGPGSNAKARVFTDYNALAQKVAACREVGMRIVLTSGTYDLLHIGHARYLERAREQGDLLIVGVDSDEKVKSRKGEHRPVVPGDERIEMLCHLRHVDLVFLKELKDPHMELIRVVRPDILIMTQDGFREEEREEREKLCGKVVVLAPQATTSTTAKIRRTHIAPIRQIYNRVEEAMDTAKANVRELVDQLIGDDG